jgi:PhnB protein
MAVKPVPDGYHAVTPFLVVRGAAAFLEFLRKAFDAKVTECHRAEDGTVMHAEARIGDSMVMVGEEQPKSAATRSSLYLYVPDADSVYRSAVAAGAVSVMEPADQFYGDRNAGVTDAFGNQWWIATRVENVPPDEMARRAAEHAKKKR